MAYISKSAPATPPDKGAFPVDRFHECTKLSEEYNKCLSENQKKTFFCQDFAKAYLQCRMDHGLMQKEDLSALGFSDKETKLSPEAHQKYAETQKEADKYQQAEEERYKNGFVAGMSRAKRRTEMNKEEKS